MLDTNFCEEASRLTLDIATKFGQLWIFKRAIGLNDIHGHDFEEMFAEITNGEVLDSRGLIDVKTDDIGWSLKTIKYNSKTTQTHVRIISGRNGVGTHFEIKNPYDDIDATGAKVLSIYNDRVREATSQYNQANIVILLRDPKWQEFCLFSLPLVEYIAEKYRWVANKNKNFVAYDIYTNQHAFTWQPNHSTFTIKIPVPSLTTRFRIKIHPTKLDKQKIIQEQCNGKDWIEFIRN